TCQLVTTKNSNKTLSTYIVVRWAHYGMVASFGFLAKATAKLPMSLAYPIWTGIGAVGTVLIGVLLFGDRLKPATWIFVILLFIGIIGIKMTASEGEIGHLLIL
ncbi:MAG: SMR family transporter, partial [Lacticaseibacillus paracasei]|nr:SMR family transporter [Lacticaseibacillus paracasei]MDN6636479.1 SMR family transporter [Lacticaseibacillus paracasei]MDN6697637.1 SMR family transporter [Lacticaseibacillus paracasei]MDN6768073.1 SMR family transporter [Lacticaseibacillus paracasei]